MHFKLLIRCADCGQDKKPANLDINLNTSYKDRLCKQCYQRRIERKETIQEISDTEISYGRDLMILKNEFYNPMKTAGLLKPEQLDSIFLNLDELIHVNTQFTTKLRAAVQGANQTEDVDLQFINIGSLFLESSTMFLTFENYCVNQEQAPRLLEQYEKEKELLRIFLHVSQNENILLRRMHLKSFLMVPVQRIMKYPLLLDRLYKATPPSHNDKEDIREAKDKIEDILGHINAKTKSISGGILRLGQKGRSSLKHYSLTEKMEISRVALEVLGWNRKDVCEIITSHLKMAQAQDHTWASKKCKNLKFSSVHGILFTLGEQSSNDNNCKKNLMFPRKGAVKQAAVVLIKEKNGKYQALREPLMLEKCIVTVDPDYDEVFELVEWNNDPYLFKADTPKETNMWSQHLKQLIQDLGRWRRRRNALPNILLHIHPE
ncbi:hypothetical protein ACJMK2_013251 [Sinanodonta woodiana]|uniref:DH domain-containing protein n=1 Tax=Sinanodonta woodiana TaxID=1069815 RepID=A0ABD3V074_SINWO